MARWLDILLLEVVRVAETLRLRITRILRLLPLEVEHLGMLGLVIRHMARERILVGRFAQERVLHLHNRALIGSALLAHDFRTSIPLSLLLPSQLAQQLSMVPVVLCLLVAELVS